jgi:transcriptional regulator with XRE-family HTH domain
MTFKIRLIEDEPPPPPALFLGEAIRMRLAWRQLKQSELAAKLGVDSSIPSLWVRNLRPVPRVRLHDLAKVLHTTATDLAGMAVPDPNGPEPPLVEDDEVLEPEPIVVGPSVFPLVWCASTHGTGVSRLHHHGPRPPWARGVRRIDDE